MQRLAMEIRQMSSSRQITVVNGGAQGGLFFFVFLTNVFFFFFNVISDILCFHSPADFTPLIVPAATLGAIGYGYMWYKVSLIRVPKVFLQ